MGFRVIICLVKQVSVYVYVYETGIVTSSGSEILNSAPDETRLLARARAHTHTLSLSLSLFLSIYTSVCMSVCMHTCTHTCSTHALYTAQYIYTHALLFFVYMDYMDSRHKR